MVSKLIFTLAIAKYLSLEEVGVYGIVAATLAFSVTMIGGEFYTYSQREMLSVDSGQWRLILSRQCLALTLVYLLLIPLHLLLFTLELLPLSVAVWFFLLLFSEHVAQECNRILVVMDRQVLATIILFLRIGAWTWPVLLVLMMGWGQGVSLVFGGWLAGGAVASSLAIYFINKSLPSRAVPYSPVFDSGWLETKAWILRGYPIGFRFLLATLSFRAVVTIDKYIVEAVEGEAFLGVYVVYFSLAMSVNAVLTPTVFSFLYPKLISSYRKKQMAEYFATLREMTVQVLVVGGGVALCIGFLSSYLFEWIGKPQYMQEYRVLWILLVMSFLYNIGMIPHYVLYAKGRDLDIFLGQIISLVSFGCLCFIFYGMLNAFLVSIIMTLAVFAGNLFKLIKSWGSMKGSSCAA